MSHRHGSRGGFQPEDSYCTNWWKGECIDYGGTGEELANFNKWVVL